MKKNVGAYLHKILNKEAFDHSGLIYGMGTCGFIHCLIQER